ncbi:MAG: hypothetical protein BGO29_07725 [Bacteroidales bacterium 36-12]|nr:MAG: hypothetical protein BGO29_07725 [Bacteroidales bacterium 36-12]
MQADSHDLLKFNYCISIAYLGPIKYYAILANSSPVLLEQHESYVKQSYRNRCTIATANGKMDLSIPIEKYEKGKTTIKDVRIAYHGRWNEQHWKAITSAYNSSPFFEYYEDELREFFDKKWTFLWDFNHAIQQKMIELIDIQPIIQLTNEFSKEYPETINDVRMRIHPKNEMINKNIIPYYQVFQNKFGFIPNLSILDLLMNMGNESILMLKNSNK